MIGYLEALDAQRSLYSAQQDLITLQPQEATNRVTFHMSARTTRCGFRRGRDRPHRRYPAAHMLTCSRFRQVLWLY